MVSFPNTLLFQTNHFNNKSGLRTKFELDNKS